MVGNKRHLNLKEVGIPGADEWPGEEPEPRLGRDLGNNRDARHVQQIGKNFMEVVVSREKLRQEAIGMMSWQFEKLPLEIKGGGWRGGKTEKWILENGKKAMERPPPSWTKANNEKTLEQVK